MSIETTCRNCGEEYDMRHGRCPVCTVEINMRAARNPLGTWPAIGYLPFEMHGERFAVTRIPRALNNEPQWRVSHIETGVAVPHTESATKEGARDVARTTLAKVGDEKLKASLANVRALFANH